MGMPAAYQNQILDNRGVCSLHALMIQMVRLVSNVISDSAGSEILRVAAVLEC